MEYKVSICIPTYNRAERLEQLLGQLCSMIVECSLQGSVEVCVSDNASDDHTGEVLRGYQTKYSFVHVRHNRQNLGFGRNLWVAAEMASGEFIYFTGDDDPFCPNGLEVLLQACADHQDAGLILFGSHPTHQSLSQGFRQGESIPLESLEKYIQTLGIFYASFIGNLCFRRSAFLENADIGQAVELSAYPHMFPVLRIVRQGKAVMINIPITVADDSARGWRKMQPVYTAVDMARIVREEMVPFLSSSAARNLLLQLARSLPRAIVQRLKKQIIVDNNNPYQSLAVSNVRSIYGWYRKSALSV